MSPQADSFVVRKPRQTGMSHSKEKAQDEHCAFSSSRTPAQARFFLWPMPAVSTGR